MLFLLELTLYSKKLEYNSTTAYHVVNYHLWKLCHIPPNVHQFQT